MRLARIVLLRYTFFSAWYFVLVSKIVAKHDEAGRKTPRELLFMMNHN